jgi:hypothetical protein
MTSISKILLTGAVAVTAIAISAAPSEAAKRKAKVTACVPSTLCSSGKASGANNVNVCGVDSKWYRAQVTPTCVQPWCPPKCG